MCLCVLVSTSEYIHITACESPQHFFLVQASVFVFEFVCVVAASPERAARIVAVETQRVCFVVDKAFFLYFHSCPT